MKDLCLACVVSLAPTFAPFGMKPKSMRKPVVVAPKGQSEVKKVDKKKNKLSKIASAFDGFFSWQYYRWPIMPLL
ncbi:hypothetical protein QR680_002975 [Steinernema hermaphroditum]|uniref:Uncharacterized protein n=1 Tax=Steinernema hermaphroditum TaxID=289476 RepID=A0AA39LJF5_9BILA|nr:hypothetical protein QR680_002975 [Steinernema hermaphroditum]